MSNECPKCKRIHDGECPTDNLTTTDYDILIGRELKDSYKIEEKIGQGGMGIVYKATQISLARKVAVKIIHGDLQSSPEFVERFNREKNILSRLDSPYIVKIIDSGSIDNDGRMYMVMEYLEGQSLEEMVKNSSLTVGNILQYMEQICMGIENAHTYELVHRDLKPKNIHISRGNKVKILDFGIAKLLTEKGLTQPGTVMGSMGYLSPEQIEDSQGVDTRADIYALGGILYFMCYKRPPYTGNTSYEIYQKQREGQPDFPTDINVIEDIKTIIRRAMQRKPENRYQEIDELKEEIRKINNYGSSQTITQKNMQIEEKKIKDSIKNNVLYTSSLQKAIKKILNKKKFYGILIALGLLLLAGFIYMLPGAETDKSAKKLGMSAAFTGPSKELGRGMRLGIETYLRYVNDNGGINGYKFSLIALDDGYEPQPALENMKKLVEKEKVFSVIGNVGTPTAKVTVPYANKNKVLFFGAFSGAGLLRNIPPDRYIFNYRASYEEETAAMVEYLYKVQNIPLEQIAIFAQHDSYGEAGIKGVAKMIRKYDGDFSNSLIVYYERNKVKDEDIDKAVKIIVKHKQVKAIIMIPTYIAAAKFIKGVRNSGMDIIFANVSFVGSKALAEALRQNCPKCAPGVIVSQVVPNFASNSSYCRQFRERLRKYFPSEKPGFVSLEGYISAEIFLKGFEKAGDNPNAEKVVDALETIHSIDLGIGEPISFGASDHQASEKVWLTVLDHDLKYQTLDSSTPLAYEKYRSLSSSVLGGKENDDNNLEKRQKEIKLGISAAFSGPARELGRGMEIGINAYLQSVNNNGRINGYKFTLNALDDAYEPERALKNTKELVEKQKVFAIIGNVGTPTAKVVVPYTNKNKVLFFGAFSGANLLRKIPPAQYVFNYRASYAEETAAIVKYLIDEKDINPGEIAIFAQKDSYGRAGYLGVRRILKKEYKYKKKPLTVYYERNERLKNVDDVAKQIATKSAKGRKIHAVVIVATYRYAARFIQKVREKGLEPIFANVSFVGSKALAEELRNNCPEYAPGIIVTQVVPHYASESDFCVEYREILKRYYPQEQPGFVSLEGYIVAKIFMKGVEGVQGELTTRKLVDSLENINNWDLGIGEKINFGHSEHQALHKIWGTVLDENLKYVPIEEMDYQ